jgi:hypothetical protein
MPMICEELGLSFSQKVAMMTVNKGVSAFSIPVKLLLICVSAAVNKKAGKKFPKKPIMSSPGKCLRTSIFLYLYSNGERKTKAMLMRMAATSSLA